MEKKRSANQRRDSLKYRRVLNPYLMQKYNITQKKFKYSENLFDDLVVDHRLSYRIINFVTLFSFVSKNVKCKGCGSGVKFEERNVKGLGFKLTLNCELCTAKSVDSCPLISGDTYEINKRLVFAMRLLGVGFKGIEQFCAFMELANPFGRSSYEKFTGDVKNSAKSVWDVLVRKACKEERKATEERGQADDGLTVVGDAIWKKMPFDGVCGIVTLVGFYKNKILDVVVKAATCKVCSEWQSKKSSAEYAEWSETHSKSCPVNVEGEKANEMMSDGVKAMFQRSRRIHGVKYSNYISESKNKTYESIIESMPYGAEVKVGRKECIDHLQKRMLSMLVACKSKHQNLAGKNKLNGKLIDELATSYALAILKNRGSVENIKKENWATLYHISSTDKIPRHAYCPEGKDSWCSWQRAKALGVMETYSHKSALSPSLFKAITPIYEDLTSDDVLATCLAGYSPDSASTFSALISKSAPPDVTSDQTTLLEIATYLAACIFNEGLVSLLLIMQRLNIKVGLNCENYCKHFKSLL